MCTDMYRGTAPAAGMMFCCQGSHPRGLHRNLKSHQAPRAAAAIPGWTESCCQLQSSEILCVDAAIPTPPACGYRMPEVYPCMGQLDFEQCSPLAVQLDLQLAAVLCSNEGVGGAQLLQLRVAHGQQARFIDEALGCRRGQKPLHLRAEWCRPRQARCAAAH